MGCLFSCCNGAQQRHPYAQGKASHLTADHQFNSCIFAAVPPGAQKAWCHHVYDGDTLTLDEGSGRRVRFLGIDAPEIKEKQAFAIEARDMARQYCDKQDVWLLFVGQRREDRYGRLLAIVYARHPNGGFLCVNEGLVAVGLAGFYDPDGGLPNRDKLLHLQASSRQARRGKWGNFRDQMFVRTKFGRAYHRADGQCEHLKHSKHLVKIREGEAMDEGLSACRSCLS